MDHKYKSLFRGININYVMTEIKIKSIFKLIGLNYTNFFIMGHLETIQYVLGTVRLSRNNRYRQLSFLVFATILYFYFFLQEIFRAIDSLVVTNGLDLHKIWEIYRAAVEPLM